MCPLARFVLILVHMKINRIAAFFAPSFDDPLWAAGCRWLGRDASSAYYSKSAGRSLFQADRSGSAEPNMPELTASARRYGFHATLKPPFRMRAHVSADQVLARAHDLAASIAPFEMPVLSVQALDSFVALRPEQTSVAGLVALSDLAEQLVRGLDDLREPATAAELAARRTDLNPAQQALLAQWGYPYVLDEWRFHMTLSRPVTEPQAFAEVLHYATDYFAPAVAQPLYCYDFCLFVESEPGAPLECWQRVPLLG